MLILPVNFRYKLGVFMRQLIAMYKASIFRRYAEGTAFWTVFWKIVSSDVSIRVILSLALGFTGFMFFRLFLEIHHGLFFVKGVLYSVLAYLPIAKYASPAR